MDVANVLRKIAKTDYYQMMYSTRDAGFKIFENNIDLTFLQVFFLNYVIFYHNLYTDIALGEVSDLVLKDIIYEDSYTLFRNKKNKNIDNKILKNVDSLNSDTWLFKSAKKKLI
jgi:hypothetical protein